MEIQRVSFINNDNRINTAKTTENKKENKEIDKNGKKKIALALGALAVIGIAGAALYKKGKIKSLADIKFSGGNAFTSDGKSFSGIIKDKLSNGDKIKLIYEDGIIQYSERKGGQNFKKIYETINGEKIVKKFEDGISTEFNITKIQNEVKMAQEKLKSILSDKTLTSSQLQDKIKDIKYISNNQKKIIEDTIKNKKQIENEALSRINQNKQIREAQRHQQILFDKIHGRPSGKSAEESAKVFLEEEHKTLINNGAIARTEQEKQIEAAQKHQDELFEAMNGSPSGKSAEESAKVFMEEQKTLINNEAIARTEQEKTIETAKKHQNKLAEVVQSTPKSNEVSAEILQQTRAEQQEVANLIAEDTFRYGGVSRDTIDRYATAGGFTPVDFTYRIGDESYHIIYEGYDCDITSDGKLLQKVRAFTNNKQKIDLKDVTEEYIKNYQDRITIIPTYESTSVSSYVDA